ncbi:MAG: SPFH domain-containing protein [Coriobacteriaceae bacterium]|jgi:regulator of protease activity HflC (stomatin/prohibitin superfamily)|nr:SPFH domain-containing protein [Coriobacteriaceae bacterium]
MPVLIGIVVVLIVVLLSTVFVVQQQYIYLIERFGRFHRAKDAGLHVRAPFNIDRIVAKVSLRLQQDSIKLEIKTKDNVFAVVDVASQFRVNPVKVQDSFYSLQSPQQQIRSYIEDSIRTAFPNLTLDEAFEKKEEIALHVQTNVREEMDTYGYIIQKVLITAIEPASEVKDSMNEINAAQRKRAAAQELAEADRIKVVTAARAQAERDQLHGEGIANERRAIVDGLAKSFEELKDAGLNESQIMSILLTEQYLDTLSDFARQGNQAIFLPAGANGAEDVRTSLLSAFAALSPAK